MLSAAFRNACRVRNSPFALANFKQVEEARHHKHLLDVVVDVLNDDLAALGCCLLADGQEQAQT